jgi:hypothetical protein
MGSPPSASGSAAERPSAAALNSGSSINSGGPSGANSGASPEGSPTLQRSNSRPTWEVGAAPHVCAVSRTRPHTLASGAHGHAQTQALLTHTRCSLPLPPHQPPAGLDPVSEVRDVDDDGNSSRGNSSLQGSGSRPMTSGKNSAISGKSGKSSSGGLHPLSKSSSFGTRHQSEWLALGGAVGDQRNSELSDVVLDFPEKRQQGPEPTDALDSSLMHGGGMLEQQPRKSVAWQNLSDSPLYTDSPRADATTHPDDGNKGGDGGGTAAGGLLAAPAGSSWQTKVSANFNAGDGPRKSVRWAGNDAGADAEIQDLEVQEVGVCLL